MEVAVLGTPIQARSSLPNDRWAEDIITLGDVVLAIRAGYHHAILSVLVAAALTYLLTQHVLSPMFTARASVILPRQPAPASAQLQMGGNLAGPGAVIGQTPEQYAALMRSRRVMDRIIERFALAVAVDAYAMEEARQRLTKRSRHIVNRKEGLFFIEVDDTDAQRAADTANAYVDELQALTNAMFVQAISDRRTLVERELTATSKTLLQAQFELQRANFNAGDSRTDSNAVSAALLALQQQQRQLQARLSALRTAHTDQSSVVLRAMAALEAIRTQAARLSTGEAMRDFTADGFTTMQRRYRGQEQAFLELSRQAEQLRIEEARGAPAILVLDRAVTPRRAAAPRPVRTTLAVAAVTAVLSMLFIVLWAFWRTRPSAGVSAHPADEAS